MKGEVIDVQKFWEQASCGEELYLKGFSKEDYQNHSTKRYQLEPEIIDFSEFDKFKGLKTLEIGVGLGADHQKLAESGAILTGIDLTERAVNHTKRRFELFNLTSTLMTANAETLPFSDQTFDAVYSWGVIHHSPNTEQIVSEIYRVLKSKGFAKIMIYHKYSLVGYMLWFRYAFLTFKWNKTLSDIYSAYLESPGTKAYSVKEAKQLFNQFKIVSINTLQTHADLLTSDVGQRHRGFVLNLAKLFWPRWFLKTFFKSHGLELLIEVRKP